MTLQERFSFSKQEKKADQKTGQKKISYISVENIRPNPYQPRRNFEPTALEELCSSIKEYGVIQPISVRKTPGNQYELIAGERRLRASTMAGLKEIPAIILDINEDDLAIMALIENLQREDLGYMEEAEGYQNLIRDHGLTQEELAQKIGKSQSTIANKIRLLKLPPIVKKMLSDNQLTERHARALLKLHDEQMQLKVLKKIIEQDLNVKKTEELVQKVLDKYLDPCVYENGRRLTRSIKDIRIFVNTIRQAIDVMKKSGVNAKAAQIDRGEFVEFIVRIPKKEESMLKAQ